MKYPSKTEIVQAVKYARLIKDSFFTGGVVTLKVGGTPKYWTGGFSMVFQITQKGEPWAFKVWHSDLGNIKDRYVKIKGHLDSCALPYFVDFEYVENGLLVEGEYYDTHRMKWIEGLTLNDYISSNIGNPNKLRSLADKFKVMVSCFHKNHLAHGDLQHGNIIVKNDGNLVVIDYDSMYVQDLMGMADVIKGLGGYQHPGRYINSSLNEKIDYFSEIIIYLSLIVYSEMPALWNKDTDWLLFSKEDLEHPELCDLFKQLKQSSNPLISILTKTLEGFLMCEDISQLMPLEFILESHINAKYPSINSITNKF